MANQHISPQTSPIPWTVHTQNHKDLVGGFLYMSTTNKKFCYTPHMQKKKVAIVGYGQFGRFMAKHLRPHCTIVPFKIDTDPEKLRSCDVVIFSVPFSSLEEVCEKLKPFISPEAFIVDVTSVKQKPLVILKKHFPTHAILGTHPIFGPQSGKNGIKNLPIVLCNISFSKKEYSSVKKFLKQKLQLHVIEQTPKEHDHEMAHVQGLTHLIGRTLCRIGIQNYKTHTKSYEQLLELKRILENDTWELFKTIQEANPEAKKVRKQFTKEILQIEKDLHQHEN